jgi:hypothetical protein
MKARMIKRQERCFRLYFDTDIVPQAAMPSSDKMHAWMTQSGIKDTIHQGYQLNIDDLRVIGMCMFPENITTFQQCVMGAARNHPIYRIANECYQKCHQQIFALITSTENEGQRNFLIIKLCGSLIKLAVLQKAYHQYTGYHFKLIELDSNHINILTPLCMQGVFEVRMDRTYGAIETLSDELKRTVDTIQKAFQQHCSQCVLNVVPSRELHQPSTVAVSGFQGREKFEFVPATTPLA